MSISFPAASEPRALSCIDLYNLYGITKSEITRVNSNEFSIPLQYLNFFPEYYLLYWSKQYLLDKLENSYGASRKCNTSYTVMFAHGLTIGKIKAGTKEQYALSFRRAKFEFGLAPTVIISE